MTWSRSTSFPASTFAELYLFLLPLSCIGSPAKGGVTVKIRSAVSVAGHTCPLRTKKWRQEDSSKFETRWQLLSQQGLRSKSRSQKQEGKQEAMSSLQN